MSVLSLIVPALAVVTWPFWHQELMPTWGDWPLTIVVMAFSLAVLRIVMVSLKEKDAAFALALKENLDAHAATIKDFSDTIAEVQKDGHKHGDDIRKSLDKLAKAVDGLKSREASIGKKSSRRRKS